MYVVMLIHVKQQKIISLMSLMLFTEAADSEKMQLRERRNGQQLTLSILQKLLVELKSGRSEILLKCNWQFHSLEEPFPDMSSISWYTRAFLCNLIHFRCFSFGQGERCFS
jgi:hypothetical protein